METLLGIVESYLTALTVTMVETSNTIPIITNGQVPKYKITDAEDPDDDNLPK